jgi:hypothetical protein
MLAAGSAASVGGAGAEHDQQPSAAADAEAVGRDCVPPVPLGDLEHGVSGAAVVGQVVGGDLGIYDVFGNTECGIPSVHICLRGSDTCTESDAAGQFVLAGLAENANTAVTFEKAGFQAALRLAELRASVLDLAKTRLITLSSLARAEPRMNTEAGKGNIVASALAAGEGIGGIVVQGGVTIKLMPEVEAPQYSQGQVAPGGVSSDTLDPSLSATQPGGWAVFWNVPPGSYTARFERGVDSCAMSLPGYGYGVDDDGKVKFEVVAGFTVNVLAFCP